MKCPVCTHLANRVIDSRMSGAGEVIRRRRECDNCKTRYTTYERVEYNLPLVIKRDGRREAFDRGKVQAGIQLACNKRPVNGETIELLLNALEAKLTELGEREVPSTVLGEAVLELLKPLDDVAYVRFASVYRSFQNLEEFWRELGKMVEARPYPVPPTPCTDAQSG
jgi:transcriptional repressor NrdR